MAKQSEYRVYRSCKFLIFLRMGIYREILWILYYYLGFERYLTLTIKYLP
jgi:hypothetical protein